MIRYSELSDDTALIEACAHPECDSFESAFEELYRRYVDRVYAIAFRMAGRTVDAMDIVQEVFTVVLRKIGTFRRDSQFSTWLFKIVVNCSIDVQRRERSLRQRLGFSLSTVDGAVEPIDPADGPVASAEITERGAAVHAALQDLSPKLRAVIVLRYLEGLSYEELADALELRLGTVKSRLARAHLAIENVIRDKWPELSPDRVPELSPPAETEGVVG